MERMTPSNRRIPSTELFISTRFVPLGDDTLGPLFWVIDSFLNPRALSFQLRWIVEAILAPRRSGVNRAENHHGIGAYHATQATDSLDRFVYLDDVRPLYDDGDVELASRLIDGFDPLHVLDLPADLPRRD